MGRFSLILIFCAHYTVQSLHQSWPAMPEGTVDAMPAWAWAQALGRNQNQTNIRMQRKCMTDGPITNDMHKGISAKGLAYPKKVAQMSGPQSSVFTGFPEQFNTGIGISAYPPPVGNPLLQAWTIEFGAPSDDTKEAATDALRQRLVQDLGGEANYHNTVMEVTGVYEVCKEHSFIVNVPSGLHAYGEALRAAFFQESYLWFHERQNLEEGNLDRCGEGDDGRVAPVGPVTDGYFREIGLGEANGVTFPLGNMCEFAKPIGEYDYPFACSISDDPNNPVMWAATDVVGDLQTWLFKECA